MSDFLDRMVARAMGTAAAVRPVLPPAGAQLDVGPYHDGVADAVPATGPGSHGHTDPGHPPAVPRTSGAPLAVHPPDADQHASAWRVKTEQRAGVEWPAPGHAGEAEPFPTTRRPVPPGVTTASPAAQSPATQSPATRSPAARTLAAQSPALSPAPPEPSVSSAVRNRPAPSASGSSVPRAASSESVYRVAPPGPPARDALSGKAADRSAPVTPPATRPAPARPVLAGPPDAPATGRREPVDPAGTARQPAPVVRLTVGRLEVRAGQPAAAPTPPLNSPRSRPRPPVSLDDYLRQRQERHR
jgi:hypothetical protein